MTLKWEMTRDDIEVGNETRLASHWNGEPSG